MTSTDICGIQKIQPANEKTKQKWCVTQKESTVYKTTRRNKNKTNNLIQSYRGYRRKIKKTKVSGAGRKDVFKLLWFVFDVINTFMQDVYTLHGTIDIMVSVIVNY